MNELESAKIIFSPDNPVPKPPKPRSEKEIMSTWKGALDAPLVSVVCVTFNQRDYIGEAIDSFLNQKTNFPFEVIIHDDYSSDGTRVVIEEYMKIYPHIIKPVFQKENQFSKGKRPTFLASRYSKGKFIALCEGDDYWLSANKLQEQADYLSSNTGYSAITHQTIKFFEDQRSKPELFTQIEKDHWGLEDLMFGRKYHTASLMVYADILRKNDIPENIVSADKAISFLLLSRGKIKHLLEPMAVYRKNPTGISSWVTADIMAKDLNLLPWLKNTYPDFPITQYRSIIHGTICRYPPKIRVLLALRHSFLFFIYSFSYFPKNLNPAIRLGLSLVTRAFRNGFSGL
jgi:glycosyltransferase involved in cell wall biosynthesis